MKNRLVFLVLFLFTIISDQLSKFLVNQHLELHETKRILGNVLYLRYIKNPGIAFGISFFHPMVMIVVTMLIIIILGYLFFRGSVIPTTKSARIAVILVLGGAIGNLIDRVRMGEVIDFIEMGIAGHYWPVYNCADIFVTVGMCILIYHFAFDRATEIDTTVHHPDYHE